VKTEQWFYFSDQRYARVATFERAVQANAETRWTNPTTAASGIKVTIKHVEIKAFIKIQQAPAGGG